MTDRRGAIDKDRIARYFLRSAGSYEQHAGIQDALADNLLRKLKLHGPLNYEKVLEIGCCTGLLTRKLFDYFDIKKLYLNDLVIEFEPIVLHRLAEKNQLCIAPLFGDVEQLEIPENLNLCVSSSTIQWLDDPISFFDRISDKTGIGGHLAISFFVSGTLKEMNEITGVGLNYIDLDRLRCTLEKRYDILCFETNCQKLYFHSGREVLHHVKNTGVGGITPYRWTKKSLLQFEQQYSELFATERGYPVTYKSVTIIGRKR